MDKSALKKAYKESKRPMGVYCVKNSQNDKLYIGIATDFQARFNRHKAELKFGNHRNKELQKIWDTTGESALEFVVLDELKQEENTLANPNDELSVLLEMWVRKLENEGSVVETI